MKYSKALSTQIYTTVTTNYICFMYIIYFSNNLHT
jgi:hypothetical protein